MGPGRGVNQQQRWQSWTPPRREPEVILRTITVVGEAPNAQGLSRYDTQTGKRIRLWARRELPWWNVFDELPEKWSAAEARQRVAWRMEEYVLGTEPYLLLGRKVCAAFRLPRNAEWLGWYRTMEHRHPMIAFPHPSPLNRWYNVEGNLERAAQLVSDIASGALPLKLKSAKDAK